MAADINNTIKRMFVQTMRDALEKGFAHTVEQTFQDSSNAAVHWAIGVEGKANPANGQFGSRRDFRETLSRGTVLYPVGRRGEKRSDTNKAKVLETARIVLDREFQDVIAVYAAGNTPSTKFYFYTAIEDEYAYNARIQQAGAMGLAEVVTEFERAIQSKNIRKYALA